MTVLSTTPCSASACRIAETWNTPTRSFFRAGSSRLLMSMPLSLRYASTNVERYKRGKHLRSLGIRRHVHPQIAIALAQGGAHEAALDRGTPVILHAGSERLADHLRNLVLEPFALVVRQRHVAGIRADRERAQLGAHGTAACQRTACQQTTGDEDRSPDHAGTRVVHVRYSSSHCETAPLACPYCTRPAPTKKVSGPLNTRNARYLSAPGDFPLAQNLRSTIFLQPSSSGCPVRIHPLGR